MIKDEENKKSNNIITTKKEKIQSKKVEHIKVEPVKVEPVKIEHIKVEHIKVEPKLLITEIEINPYEQYIIDNEPFRIYLKNKIIFDTKNKLRKDYPIFNNNYFILNGINYIYRGIIIEKY